ncbi:MAG: hypothetical protein CMK56_05630 [Proteobacteria bacterium]|nr:hypothetical protein [Pseudomonadota bacterium]
MKLRYIAIGLNTLLLMLCVGFFVGHGLPKSLILWGSAVLWFVAPLVNLAFIFRLNKKNRCNSFPL